ncbi:MAG: STAS domain-containing protein [Polyangiaceae bacterium]|nr:STAS domain-containing protein [Polyangiaceae bacterium]
MTIQAIHAHLSARTEQMREEYIRLLHERVPFFRTIPDAQVAHAAEILFKTFLEALAASDMGPILTWATGALKVRAEQGLPLDGALIIVTQFRRAVLLALSSLPPAELSAVIEVLLFVDDLCEAYTDAATSVYMQALHELSTPLIPVSDGVVVMPLVGVIDRARAERLRDVLLAGVAAEGASVAILDVTAVSNMGASVADALLSAAKAAQLLGAEVLLTGIRPAAARALVELGADLSGVVTRATLKDGISFALARERRAGAGR